MYTHTTKKIGNQFSPKEIVNTRLPAHFEAYNILGVLYVITPIIICAALLVVPLLLLSLSACAHLIIISILSVGAIVRYPLLLE